jgi:hypothetical protein
MFERPLQKKPRPGFARGRREESQPEQEVSPSWQI